MARENHLEQAKQQYQAGRAAFERGQYRQSIKHLETARQYVQSPSSLGGSIQIWLVTAYEALGERDKALKLCKQLVRHPDMDTRKQARGLVDILEAPRLKKRPEWLVQIPDMQNLEDSNAKMQPAASTVKKAAPKKKKPTSAPPVDWSQVNTKDNGFVWIALAAILLAIAAYSIF
ncbi:hypothetical protein [Geitlerinema sp. PCC 9228]|jgi:tetratricopeptide (TPR) repeat protein|uniref:hypothetical protein n=1 Tax=Geitlerinema sp. PCC 9228 TaxID=111611 RepID=UPI0008F9C52B|nr:hypothetical protein [Geitlerinema sp. PCC 9228]